uniref:hypothetical protein n=1 Tax=Winogradskyella sp. TaxID=1883156 RepID=UPI003F69A42A
IERTKVHCFKTSYEQDDCSERNTEMAKFITLFLIFIFIGCEMSSNQVIKSEKFTYDVIKFDTVSKTLLNEFSSISPDHKIMSEIIQYWFDNRIKTDGFEGNLLVNVKKTQFERVKKQDYYKFSVYLSLDVIEKKSLSKITTYNVKSNEYGELLGSFAIKDQDNLDLNLMHKSLESISSKLTEAN